MKRSPRELSSSSCSSSSSVGGFESPNRRRNKCTTTTTSSSMIMKPRQNSTSYQKQSTGSRRRSSIYRGVTRHRLTGRFEAHLWDKSSWNSVQTKKGRQVYLGAYDIEETAARTYDLAALKYWGKDAILNFPIETYTKEIEEMDMFSREEFLASLRRHSNGFSRGVSKYRGVARHHHNGRWEARIGRVNGSKYIYLGTFETQEEAAEAYDKAALEYRGLNAVTNFDKRKYKDQIPRNKNEQSSQVTQSVQKRKRSKQSQLSATETETSRGTDPSNYSETEHVAKKQDQPLEVQCNSISSVPLSMESIITPVSTSSVVDNNVIDQDLPWNFMDGVILPQFQTPELASSRAEDVLSLFYNAEFDDADIEFLFSSEPTESDFNLSAVLDSFGSDEDVVNDNNDNKINRSTN